MIAGGVAIWASPVSQYPNIVPPCLSITATFPGANSEAIANAVAAPLEDQMSGIANMIYMQSTSANGSNTVTLNVYFQVGINLQLVEADAINRINTAMPQLPAQVQAQGVVVRLKNPDLFLAIPFYSDTGYPDSLYISNYVQRYIYPEIEQIPGVGVVAIQGQRAFAMRAILDVNKMAYYKISTHDIVSAITDQNYQYAIGFNAMEPMEGKEKFNFVINPPGYYTNESQFQNIVLRASESNAQVIKLQDVSRVKLDAQQYTTYYYAVLKDKNNKVQISPATALLVYLEPSANQIKVKKAVNAVLEEASAHMPDGIKYYYHYDSSEFVLESVQAVISTLLIAFVLVFIVVMLFIQNIRGTIIPVLAIPVSIIGAFAGTYALGFSINTMTLFGMVLAIGIVVDDAIVVLECVERIMRETGRTSLECAIDAMGEVASPIIAIVLVLNAVFLPVAFLGGFSGVLMQQFAVTIAISVFLSGLVALTLTPTLCAIFMRNLNVNSSAAPKFKFFKWFNQGFESLKNRYIKIVTWIIDNIKIALIIWLSTVITVIILFIKIPTSLIPLEDMSYFYDTIHVTSGGSMEYLLEEAKKISKEVVKLPIIKRVAILGGLDLVDNSATKTSAATLSIILNPYDERTKTNQDVNAGIKLVTEINNKNKEINAMAFNQPPIRGMSPTGGVTFYLQAKQPVTTHEIYEDSVKLVKYLEKHYPAILNAHQFYDVHTPQIYINMDAQKSYLYGITYAQVYNSLQSIFGVYYVNYFTKWNDLYWVVLQGDYKYRNQPELLNTVYVKSNKGQIIPVGSLATMEYKNGPEVVTRFNDYLASQIVANPDTKNGHTQGEVMDAVRDAMPKALGKKYVAKWFGPAYQENLAGSQSIIAFTLGLIMVFLILAALYELWTLPAAVIVALPFALLGAALMLVILRKPNDIYFQISLLTLIGLSAKNAILILEFAIEGVRRHSMTYRDAAIHAATVRFRPIIMTSIAFIFGAIPLAFATGAGANAQHSVGTGIIGGMLGSTCIATLFVPMFFVLAMKISDKTSK
jgi:hydrophobe/amphiphile efflux-1 (HAE1) family protein